MKGGKYLNNWRMAEIHAQESADRVRELEQWKIRANGRHLLINKIAVPEAEESNFEAIRNFGARSAVMNRSCHAFRNRALRENVVAKQGDNGK